MLTQAQLTEFNEKGYLKIGRVMSDEKADEMRQRLFDVMEGKSARNPESNRNLAGEGAVRVVVQIVNIWEADDLFEEHISNPIICEAAAQLMSTDTVRVWHDQVQYKPPFKGGRNEWHQDHPLWPIIQPADLVSAWVALDDATVENGCMNMVPGSHLWGAHKGGIIGSIPETFDPMADLSLLPPNARIEVVPCEVKKGEAMFHHCLTWHGSPVNHSPNGRPAIAVHYMPGHTRYVPAGRTHLVEHNIHVAPGEILTGDHFPTVWEKK